MIHYFTLPAHATPSGRRRHAGEAFSGFSQHVLKKPPPAAESEGQKGQEGGGGVILHIHDQTVLVGDFLPLLIIFRVW